MQSHDWYNNAVGKEKAMSSKVVKGLLSLMVVVVLIVIAPTQSEARIELGQFCWTLTGFADVIRCSLSLLDGAEPMTELHCSDQVAGNSGYQLLGAGLARLSFPTAGSLQAGFTMTHNTTAFGGNKTCSFFATLDTTTFGGPLTVECPGDKTTAKYKRSATMVLAPSCTAPASAAPASAAEARGLGR